MRTVAPRVPRGHSDPSTHAEIFRAGSSATWYFTRVGTPAVSGLGVGWTGGRIHAPNENIRLEDARRGIKATAAAILNFGAKPR
ncbi:MAG: M20/M25/M40 family metallo-hydrolase [Euryarchaeota archaeon]|nr:M20/M25/M40 family metallo-hydrolase [Euryarchaeota archaeon]